MTVKKISLKKGITNMTRFEKHELELNNTDKIVFFDFETTGLSHTEDHPTEIAVKVFHKGKRFTEYESMIQLPEGVEVSKYITKLTGLTTKKVNSEGKSKDQVKQELIEFLGDIDNAHFVAHFASFDLGFLMHHFGIEPKLFICTKSVSTLTDPTRKSSLQACYDHYYPEREFAQTHRAMDDVNMMIEVMIAQLREVGTPAFEFFKNRLVSMPSRELRYVPSNAIVVDFAKDNVTKKEYDNVAEDAEKLAKLEAYGVDNWSGYGDALSDSEGIFE